MSFPEAKVIILHNSSSGMLQHISKVAVITVLFFFFCLDFLTGNFISYPTGGDICGEDNSEDGQDRNQRGMFRYVEPVT